MLTYINKVFFHLTNSLCISIPYVTSKDSRKFVSDYNFQWPQSKRIISQNTMYMSVSLMIMVIMLYCSIYS